MSCCAKPKPTPIEDQLMDEKNEKVLEYPVPDNKTSEGFVIEDLPDVALPAENPEYEQDGQDQGIESGDATSNKSKQLNEDDRSRQSSVSKNASGPSIASQSIAKSMEEKNVPAKSMGGRSMTLQSLGGQSAAGKGLGQRSATLQSLGAQSAAGQSMAGQSAAGPSMAGQSAAGRSMTRQSDAGQSMAGQTVEGQSMAGQTAEGQSMAGQSMGGKGGPGKSIGGKSGKSGRTIGDDETIDDRTLSELTNYSAEEILKALEDHNLSEIDMQQLLNDAYAINSKIKNFENEALAAAIDEEENDTWLRRRPPWDNRFPWSGRFPWT